MGMFLSLGEAARAIHCNEEEVLKLVRTGVIREFRDGPNMLLKTDEVERHIRKQQGPHWQAFSEMQEKGEQNKEFYEEEEVLDMLKISSKRFQKLIESKKLKGFTDGVSMVVRRTDLEKYLKEEPEEEETIDIVTAYRMEKVRKLIKWLSQKFATALDDAEELMGFKVTMSEAKNLLVALIQESPDKHFIVIQENISKMTKNYGHDIIRRVCDIDSSLQKNLIEYIVENLARWEQEEPATVSSVDLSDLEDDGNNW